MNKAIKKQGFARPRELNADSFLMSSKTAIAATLDELKAPQGTLDDFVQGDSPELPAKPAVEQGRALHRVPSPPPIAAPVVAPPAPAVARPRMPLPAARDLLEDQLSSRVMKQINFDMPETEHHDLKSLVMTMPNMSLRKFYLQAVREKMARVRAGDSDTV